MTTQGIKSRMMKSELYREEFGFIFNDRKAFCVRGALVISAFVEAQTALVTKANAQSLTYGRRS
jgi:hypothetical protein